MIEKYDISSNNEYKSIEKINIKQMIILFRGLPGVGKSFLIKNLIQSINNTVIINRDEIRIKLFSPPLYTEIEKQFVNENTLYNTKVELSKSHSVIIDGMTFARYNSIEPFHVLAYNNKIPIKIIECVCSKETALRRILWDIEKNLHPATDRDLSLYHKVNEYYENIDLPGLIINTEKQFNINIKKILNYLLKDNT